MADALERLRAFLAELRRRKVYQVAAVYVVLAIAGLEVVATIVPASRLPEWSDELFLALVILGFPLAVALAWTFDVTADGVRVTAGRPETGTATGDEVAAAPGAGASVDTLGGRRAGEPETAAGALDPCAVAVLPFENLSGTDDAGPFAAGLHDDVLTELSRVSALTVISRTSVMRYRDSGKTIREISRELGAGTIVEGGVQRVGSRVRLNVQLIDARTDSHGWAERYDRELTASEIFDIQTELARRIAATVEAELTSEERGRVPLQPTQDLEAYRLHALGREVFVGRTEAGLRQAASYFEAATERDPEYALAWAGLGLAIAQLADYGHTDAETHLPRAVAAAKRALELDPMSAEAYAVLGCVHIAAARREGPRAVGSLERAVELQPSYAGAHQWLCWAHLLLGDPSQALESGRQAIRLDPLDPEARGNVAVAHLGCGDPAAALEEARRTLERYPDFDYARWCEAVALTDLGRGQEASRAFSGLAEGWARAWPRTAHVLDRLHAGDQDGAREAQRRSDAGTPPFHVALLHRALGEVDDAFSTLRRAHPLAWDETLYLRYALTGPAAALRGDARSEGLLGDVDRSWGLEVS